MVAFRVRLLAVLAVLACTLGPTRGATPQGYADESFAHVARTLASVWGNLTSRDPSELLATLSVTAGAHGVGRALRYGSNGPAPCIPRKLKPRLKRVETAVALMQLAYDPQRGSGMVGQGPLAGFKMLDALWDAQPFKPAVVMLQSKSDPSEIWVVVRGTASVSDLITNLSTEPKAILDGYAHGGILQAANFVYKFVKRRCNSTNEIHLTGHSLGGAAGALAAVLLNNAGFPATAIAFGAPSCVFPAPWLSKMLANKVTSIVLDADLVPRLNNATLHALLAPEDASVNAAVQRAVSYLKESLLDVITRNGPLSDAIGLKRKEPRPGMQVPPGRQFLLRPSKAVKNTDWDFREVPSSEFDEIILCSTMLQDHTVASYLRAVQSAHIRHLPECDQEEPHWERSGGRHASRANTEL